MDKLINFEQLKNNIQKAQQGLKLSKKQLESFKNPSKSADNTKYVRP